MFLAALPIYLCTHASWTATSSLKQFQNIHVGNTAWSNEKITRVDFFGTPTKSMVGSRLALSKYIFEFLPAGNSKFTSYYPSHKASEKGSRSGAYHPLWGRTK